jgi:DNA-binding transcriptional regulator YiaG
MEKEEFRRALGQLEISQRKFAYEVGMDVTTVNRWATGQAEVPGIAAAYVRLKLKMKAFCRDISGA